MHRPRIASGLPGVCPADRQCLAAPADGRRRVRAFPAPALSPADNRTNPPLYDKSQVPKIGALFSRLPVAGEGPGVRADETLGLVDSTDRGRSSRALRAARAELELLDRRARRLDPEIQPQGLAVQDLGRRDGDG